MNVKVTWSSKEAFAALLLRSHRKHGKTTNDEEKFRFRVNFNSVWTNPCPLWNSLGSAGRTLSILVYHINTYFLRAKTKKNRTEAVNLEEGQTWVARPWCPSLLSGRHWVRERIELVTALYIDDGLLPTSHLPRAVHIYLFCMQSSLQMLLECWGAKILLLLYPWPASLKKMCVYVCDSK